MNPRSIKVRKLIAFVAQDESLQMTATPREAIAFSARLRLPRGTSDPAIEKLTKRMLTELGLDDCADTIIGSALVKGLSGGERKRTSIGVELVVKVRSLAIESVPNSNCLGRDFSSLIVCLGCSLLWSSWTSLRQVWIVSAPYSFAKSSRRWLELGQVSYSQFTSQHRKFSVRLTI